MMKNDFDDKDIERIINAVKKADNIILIGVILDEKEMTFTEFALNKVYEHNSFNMIKKILTIINQITDEVYNERIKNYRNRDKNV